MEKIIDFLQIIIKKERKIIKIKFELKIGLKAKIL